MYAFSFQPEVIVTNKAYPGPASLDVPWTGQVFTTALQLLVVFSSIPFVIFALLVLLPPSRNSGPGSQSRLFSPPSPLRYLPCNFMAKLIYSALSSLVGPRFAESCI